MKVRGTHGSLRVGSAVLTGLCAAIVTVAAIGSQAAFAGPKHHTGHGSLPSKGNIPAKFQTLPTGPHPSETKNAGKFKPQQL
ncbi:hypothetical protein [Burkholderia stagnalis]|uniref:hypothetical protein n=1 Tax=Burkholderia stagnalis TaxID=1503054 RepID=UPI0007C5D4F4|nr:hypothetical protein [Burkholderia stagnalis]